MFVIFSLLASWRKSSAEAVKSLLHLAKIRIAHVPRFLKRDFLYTNNTVYCSTSIGNVSTIKLDDSIKDKKAQPDFVLPRNS